MEEQDKVKKKEIEEIVRSYCQEQCFQVDWEDIPETTKEKLIAVWYEMAMSIND